MNKKRTRWAAGFTLLEVMLVLLILAMLVGVGIFGYGKSQTKAEKQTTLILVTELGDAVEHYRRVVRAYPPAEDGLEALVTPPDEDAARDRWLEEGPFVRGGKVPLDVWDNEILYKLTDEDEAATTGVFFRVYSPGPNGEDDSGTGDDIPAWAED